jgi:hypothetical protein
MIFFLFADLFAQITIEHKTGAPQHFLTGIACELFHSLIDGNDLTARADNHHSFLDGIYHCLPISVHILFKHVSIPCDLLYTCSILNSM